METFCQPAKPTPAPIGPERFRCLVAGLDSSLFSNFFLNRFGFPDLPLLGLGPAAALLPSRFSKAWKEPPD